MPESSPFSLAGKVVVQFGGTGLLGRALVDALGAAGATLVIASRNRAAIEAGLTAGRRQHAEQVDITQEASVAALCDRVVAAHGRIDGLVFNAVSRPMRNERDTVAAWEESMRVNATGLFLTLRTFADAMAAQPTGGSIVNIASIQGMVGANPWLYEGTAMGTVPDYFFHKGGMLNLTRHYASLYGPKKVRVNVVSPGGIYNPEKPQAAPFLERYGRMTMLGRMAEAREIGGAVVFLLSDAASYVTGVNLPVDGGYTAK
ncbi:MAG: SDR family oxidoreductase [Opitutaceae bacterium]|nr:SDR family oxidoreductase [Opitutaceae bacterium]